MMRTMRCPRGAVIRADGLIENAMRCPQRAVLVSFDDDRDVLIALCPVHQTVEAKWTAFVREVA